MNGRFTGWGVWLDIEWQVQEIVGLSWNEGVVFQRNLFEDIGHISSELGFDLESLSIWLRGIVLHLDFSK
jgi:hypothetical protein